MKPEAESSESLQKPTLKQLIGSVLSAAIGIQSRKNRERDFKNGSVKTFVIAGIAYVLLFIAAVFTMVKLVLAHNGY